MLVLILVVLMAVRLLRELVEPTQGAGVVEVVLPLQAVVTLEVLVGLTVLTVHHTKKVAVVVVLLGQVQQALVVLVVEVAVAEVVLMPLLEQQTLVAVVAVEILDYLEEVEAVLLLLHIRKPFLLLQQQLVPQHTVQYHEADTMCTHSLVREALLSNGTLRIFR
jgi:hypothetical protein